VTSRLYAYGVAGTLHLAMLVGSKFVQLAPAQSKKEYCDVTLEAPPPPPVALPSAPPPVPPPVKREHPRRMASHEERPRPVEQADPPPIDPPPTDEPPPSTNDDPPGDAIAPLPSGAGKATSVGQAPVGGAPFGGTLPVLRHYLTVAKPSYARLVEPVYPPAARRQRQQGTVTLMLYIDERGALEKVEVRRSSGHPLLDNAALAALAACRFAPAYRDNQAFAAKAEVSITFQLQ
jgi:protein TonB